MLKRCVVSGFAVALCSTGVFADEGAKFQLQQDVLTWHSVHAEAKTDAGTTKTDTTSLATAPVSLQLLASWGKYNVYVWPVSGGSVGVGYLVIDNLEVGLKLGLSSMETKVGSADKVSTSNNGYGVWALYTMGMGENYVELTVPINMSSGSAPGTVATEKKTTSGMNFGFSAEYFMPLAKNFVWGGGLSYTMNSGEEKDGSTKITNSGSDIGLTLTKFRYNF